MNSSPEREEKIRPEIRGSRVSINEQIDDIFSELTEEIYNDDKVTRTDRRRIFDPLPSPPNTRTHPPPVDRKKKPTSNGVNNRTDIADIRSRTIEYDRSLLTSGNVAAKKQFLERNSSGGGGIGANKTGSGRSGGGRSQSSGSSGGRSRGSADSRQQQQFRKRDNNEAVLYGGDDHRRMERINEKVSVDVHDAIKNGHSPPPPKPEKQRIHLRGSTDRQGTNRTDSTNHSKERTRSRQRDAGRDESKTRDKSAKRAADGGINSKEVALMNELKEKVTDTKGKISKFSDKRDGKNVPLPPPPPPPITPSAHRNNQSVTQTKQFISNNEEKNSTKTSSSSGKRNRDASPRRGASSPVQHTEFTSKRGARDTSPRSARGSSPRRSTRGSSPRRRGPSPSNRSLERRRDSKSPSRTHSNMRSPSERRIAGSSPSSSSRRARDSKDRRQDRKNMQEDNKRSKSLGPLHGRQESPDRLQNGRQTRERYHQDDADESRGRSRSRGRPQQQQEQQQQPRRPGDGSSFHRSKSQGRYSPSRPSQLDRSGQGGREGDIGDHRQRRADYRDGAALSPTRRDGFSPRQEGMSPHRRDGFSPNRREFSPSRRGGEFVGGGRGEGYVGGRGDGRGMPPPSPEEAQAVLEKMLPR